MRVLHFDGLKMNSTANTTVELTVKRSTLIISTITVLKKIDTAVYFDETVSVALTHTVRNTTEIHRITTYTFLSILVKAECLRARLKFITWTTNWHLAALFVRCIYVRARARSCMFWTQLEKLAMNNT